MACRRNILITSANFPKGSAAANYLNLFCKGLVSSGQEIEVYILKGYFLQGQRTDDSKKNRTDYGVKYTYLSFIHRSSNNMVKVIGDLYGIISLTALLLSFFTKRKNITIFSYNNEPQHSILLNIYCRLTGINLITFVPEYYDKSVFAGNIFHKLRWYGFLLNFHYLNRLSDKLIVFSTYIRERYIQKQYRESRILVQPNLTDFDFWDMNKDEIIFTIGYSGTPYKKDGIEDLLASISILHKMNYKVNAVIIGDVVTEKSIIPSLKEYCRELQIEKSIMFTGHVPLEEVRNWLNKCMILAITRPSIIQTVAGFPTKIGEYFACRKTVLSTRIGDVANYFSDRDEIVFAESGNPQSIADNIAWILNHRAEGEKIAGQGYARAKELLNYRIKVPFMYEFASGSLATHLKTQ